MNVTNSDSCFFRVNGKKETMKLFFKVWNAYTKYILRQWVQKRCFVSPFIGSFLQSKSDNKKFQFIPNKEFLEAGGFRYDTAKNNNEDGQTAVVKESQGMGNSISKIQDVAYA